MKTTRLFIGFGVLSTLMAIILTPSLSELWEGFLRIQTHHLRLDSDMFSIAGNLGSPFLNASLLLFVSLLLYKLTDTEINGLEIAAMLSVYGFGFYAKSLFNVWPFIFGVLIEAKLNKVPLKRITFLALMCTALGPFVSTIAFDIKQLQPGSPLAIILAYTVGILMSYVTAKVNAYFWKLHQGRILLNMGFTTGIVGIFTYNFMKAIGLEFNSDPSAQYLLGIDSRLVLAFSLLILYFPIYGLAINKGFTEVKKEVISTLSDGGDYVVMYGLPKALINMGIVGLLSLLLLLLIPNTQINGPTISGIFVVVGFGAYGMTLRNVLPLWFGFIVTCLIVGALYGLFQQQPLLQSALDKLSNRSMLIAIFHGLGLAPTVKRDGVKCAMILASLHILNVTSTGILTGRMHAYNNGFSMALVVILFIPIWRLFSHQRIHNPQDLGY